MSNSNGYHAICGWSPRAYHLLFVCLLVAVAPSARAQLGTQIVGPIELRWPNGGERLIPGSTVTIRWGITTRRIDEDSTVIRLSTDGGSSWTFLKGTFKDSTYSWVVPDLQAENCLIQVVHERGWSGQPRKIGVVGVRTTGIGFKVRFSPDGSLIVLSRDSLVTIVETRTGRELHRFALPARVQRPCDISGDNRYVAVQFVNDPRAFIYDLQTRSVARIIELPSRIILGKTTTDDVRDVTFTPDSKQLLVAANFMPSFWDIASGRLVDSLTFGTETREIARIEYSDDGKRILLQKGAKVRVIDASTRAIIRDFNVKTTGLQYFEETATLGPGGRTIVGGSDTLFVFDVDTGNRVYFFQNPERNQVKFQMSVVAKSKMRILRGNRYSKLMRVSTLERYGDQFLWLLPGSVYYMAISADASHAVVTDSLGSTTLWNLVRADTSDAYFSIGQSRPDIVAINMGAQKVGVSRDSTIAGFLVNSAVQPLSITRMHLEGRDSADFELVAGSGPTTIAGGGTLPLTVRFAPRDSGDRATTLVVETESGRLTTELSGTALRGRIKVIEAWWLFDAVPIGERREKVAPFLTCIGTASVRLDSFGASLNLVGRA